MAALRYLPAHVAMYLVAGPVVAMSFVTVVDAGDPIWGELPEFIIFTDIWLLIAALIHWGSTAMISALVSNAWQSTLLALITAPIAGALGFGLMNLGSSEGLMVLLSSTICGVLLARIRFLKATSM